MARPLCCLPTGQTFMRLPRQTLMESATKPPLRERHPSVRTKQGSARGKDLVSSAQVFTAPRKNYCYYENGADILCVGPQLKVK